MVQFWEQFGEAVEEDYGLALESGKRFRVSEGESRTLLILFTVEAGSY